MNRHERRKQKKYNKNSHTVSQDLLEAIRLHTIKDYEKAETLYNKVLSSDPKNYETLRHLGILHQDLEKYEEAYNYFMQALKVNSNGFQALSNLATIHMQNKNYELAYKCLSKSFSINSSYVPTINNLAGYFHKMNRAKDALYYSQLSIKIQPNNPLALNQYAKALIINDQLEEAIDLLKNLNEQFPNEDDFKYNLSSAYREIGDFKKANKISSEGFKKNFRNISYFLGYTKDRDNKLEDEHVKYYDELLGDENLNSEDKALICHAFFEYFKNQKDYKKAGSYLIKGNEAQYACKSFDINLEKVFYKKLKSLFSKKINFKCNDTIKNQIPIFVCGMPRSGTTLCEQILSSHSKVTGAGELDFLAEVSNCRLIQPDEKEINNLEAILGNEKSLLTARTQYLERLSQRDKNKSIYY